MKGTMKQVLVKPAEYYTTGDNAGELKNPEYIAVNMNIPIDTEEQYIEAMKLFSLLKNKDVFIRIADTKDKLDGEVPMDLTEVLERSDGESA